MIDVKHCKKKYAQITLILYYVQITTFCCLFPYRAALFSFHEQVFANVSFLVHTRCLTPQFLEIISPLKRLHQSAPLLAEHYLSQTISFEVFQDTQKGFPSSVESLNFLIKHETDFSCFFFFILNHCSISSELEVSFCLIKHCCM